MAATLRLANEKDAYTLSDRGTFLAHRRRLALSIVPVADPGLRNQYSVIVVSHERHPENNHAVARRFAEFLFQPDVQRRIAEFGKDKFGEPLFFVEDSTGRP
jgi:tungstate transport system substrate-binding protein